MLVRKVTDQMGRPIELPMEPQRIISLVPSQTELLYDLGLGDRIVGQTLFCIHPRENFKHATKIGGTKKLKIEKIEALQADLIIGNKEENDREQIELLSTKFPVWMSDIKTPEDALQMISSIGQITNTKAQAEEIIAGLQAIYRRLSAQTSNTASTIYLIWKNPWMAAGDDTYIHHMLQICGYQNLIQGRYPEINFEEIQRLQPDSILLSSEPYPFKQTHLDEFKHILPNTEVKLVDGEFYSWYGSRLLHLVG